MRQAFLALLLAAAASTACAAPRRHLVWHDEFNGPRGTRPDQAKWKYDIGGHGWGNNELEYYTDQNAAMDGRGHLVLEARKEKKENRDYTSARLLTAGKASWKYARVEARIKVPTGRGIWPAFWMLGENIGEVGWPQCGEIDILEHVGHKPKTVHATLHGPGYSAAQGIGQAWESKAGPVSDDFHVYRVDWEPKKITWSVDGQVYFVATPRTLKSKKWVFDTPFFLILNVAVGGHWPGEPDATTPFPARMWVDWVRVYQDEKHAPGLEKLDPR